MIFRWFSAVVLALICNAALSQASAAPTMEPIRKEVTFHLAGSNEDTVNGVLTTPATLQDEKAPAIVLLHHGGGWQNTQTRQYAEALSKAGYATLELILFNTGDEKMAKPSMYLPHVYGALKFLSKQPYVDAKRIAVSGGSYGGLLTILTATDWAYEQYGAPEHIRFAAHAAFYPMCWAINYFVVKKPGTPDVPGTVYDKYTGAPVKIYAGSEDDYDGRDPKACDNLVLALPEDQRSAFSVRVFQGATHGWDHQRNSTFYEKIACKGKGCYNTNTTDAKITAEGIEDLKEFLKTAMPK